MKDQRAREQSLWSRLSYGFADIYGGGAFVIISTFYTVFLTKAMGMSPAMAGTIPLIGKVWDAVTDPIMGNICDRTRSRFGPKRFYMLIGSFISAVTFILMWVSLGKGSSMTAKYLFYVLMYMLFSTGFTIVMVPYNGLLHDMVDDYTVRSRFSGMRMIFSTFGAILAGLVPTLLIRDNTDPAPYLTVALLFGVLFLVVILLTFAGTWEKQKPPVRVGFARSFIHSLTVYKSRSFRIFIGIFLCGQGAADFLTGLAVYYVDDVLNAYGGGRFTYLMGVILLSQFVGTILFTPFMAKTSKKMPLLVGFPVRIGLGMAGSSTTIYAILADMADVDRLITSLNRPGICAAMATFIRKIATGVSSAVIGLLLAWVGYSETLASAGQRQTFHTQQGIALIYIFAPVVLMVLAIGFTVLFPMQKKEFEIVKKEIARRLGEDSSSPTPEEISTCEKITGFRYEELWNEKNALSL